MNRVFGKSVLQQLLLSAVPLGSTIGAKVQNCNAFWCVCACVRACMRACVRACVCMRVCLLNQFHQVICIHLMLFQPRPFVPGEDV